MKKIFLISLFLISCNSITDISFNSTSTYPDISQEILNISEEVVSNDTKVEIQRRYSTPQQVFTEIDGYHIIEYYERIDETHEELRIFNQYYRSIHYIDENNTMYYIGYALIGSYPDYTFIHNFAKLDFDTSIEENVQYTIPLNETFTGTLIEYIDYITTKDIISQDNLNLVNLIESIRGIFIPVYTISWEYNYQI